jgi:hypothetical protein
MALPSDDEICYALMALLRERFPGRMHCTDVYQHLEREFPQLTWDDTRLPYQNSRSHFANRVQFAVLHLRQQGWLMRPSVSGRGYWELSKKAWDHWSRRHPNAEELLRALMEG